MIRLAATVAPTASPAPQQHAVVCLARNAAAARHLQPIATAGGWPLLGPDQISQVSGAVAVVAFAGDEPLAMRHGARGTVLGEHGSGQCYDDPSLPADSVWRGGRGAGAGRLLFLAPGELIARRHQAAHPAIPVAVVGCPMLDAWHGRTWSRQPRPKICLSSHWDCRTLPETRSAWPWIRDHLAPLAGCPQWQLLGHYHPHEERMGALPARLAAYAAHGIEILHTWEEVLATADLFISDNSSTLYEFAATGRPVVALNPPWYRRAVHHGLRFWTHVPGLQVDQPRALLPAVRAALQDRWLTRRQRASAVRAAYGPLDGRASARAAAAIGALLPLVPPAASPTAAARPNIRPCPLRPLTAIKF